MTNVINFARRNLRVFFRDRLTLFLSLLGPFVIIGLYSLFLGNMWGYGETAGVTREMVDAWMLAGMLAVTSVTTSMGAFGIMITDRSRKINKDFYCAPVRQQDYAGGYILSAYLIGMILSVGTLCLAQGYLLIRGGDLFSVGTFIKVLLLLFLVVFSNSSLMFFVTTFLRSDHAFTTVCTAIGMIIGFLTGCYVPIGQLPTYAQWLVRIFPPSHAACLLRGAILKPYFAQMKLDEESVNILKQELGVQLSFEEFVLAPIGNAAVLFAAGVLFFWFAGRVLSRKQR